MSPIQTDDLEQRLGAALDRRARAAAVPPHDEGRSAVSGRVEQRARHRRIVRAAGSVGLVVVLIAVGVGLSRRGGDSTKVISGPTNPVVQLPRVGLVGPGDVWALRQYSPGRFEQLYVWPAGTPSGQVDGLIIAPDASAGTVPTTGAVEAGRVHGAPAEVIPLTSTTPAAAVVWEIAPGMRAMLTSGGMTINAIEGSSTTASPPVLDRALAARLLAVANRIVSVSDEAWANALRYGRDSAATGFHPITPLVLAAPHGSTEINVYEPGFFALESLDVPGFAPGTFSLTYQSAGPAALNLKGLATVRILGKKGAFVEDVAGQSPHQLSWAEPGVLVTLSYPDGPTHGQAIAVANSLTVVTPARWQALLFPVTLRTDLVPVPHDLFDRMLHGGVQTSTNSSSVTSTTR